ncbi:MAG: hypothetical protein ACKOBW_11295 [Planctomycetota bacterium]
MPPQQKTMMQLFALPRPENKPDPESPADDERVCRNVPSDSPPRPTAVANACLRDGKWVGKRMSILNFRIQEPLAVVGGKMMVGQSWPAVIRRPLWLF